MGLHALVLIRDWGLRELIRDLLLPEDEVRAVWPPSEKIRGDAGRPIQLLVVDEDDLPSGSPLSDLIRRWSGELPTVLLSSRVAAVKRQGRCLILPKPIPLPAFFTFVNALRQRPLPGSGTDVI